MFDIKSKLMTIINDLKINQESIFNYLKVFSRSMLILVVTIIVVFFVLLINSFKKLSETTNAIFVAIFMLAVFYVFYIAGDNRKNFIEQNIQLDTSQLN